MPADSAIWRRILIFASRGPFLRAPLSFIEIDAWRSSGLLIRRNVSGWMLIALSAGNTTPPPFFFHQTAPNVLWLIPLFLFCFALFPSSTRLLLLFFFPSSFGKDKKIIYDCRILFELFWQLVESACNTNNKIDAVIIINSYYYYYY